MKASFQTKRLTISPLSDAALQALISAAEDGALRQAYLEMLSGSEADPDNRLWYVPWAIELTKGRQLVGYAGFHGPVADDAVELGYGILPGFEGRGYATEAANAMTEWAFQDEAVFFVEAEAEEHNAASLHILDKLGFVRYGNGAEGPRFVKERPATAYLSIGICLGLCFGLAIGQLFFDSYSVYLCVGMALGGAVGGGLDQRARKKLAAAKARRSGCADPDGM